MKEQSAGNMHGFSIIEIMIALAIITTALAAAVSGNAATQYWRMTARAGYEALGEARAQLQDIQTIAQNDFLAATSSPMYTVTDISPCLKSIITRVSWRIETYPTSTIALSTIVTDPAEAIALGGDCETKGAQGNWATPVISSPSMIAHGVPQDIDVLNGMVYIATNEPPYVYTSPTNDCTSCEGSYRALDAVRDLHTGRTYVYAAAATSTNQLHVIDATDPEHLVVVAKRSLALATGSFPQGWRVHAYGDRAYIVTRETAGPEFHIFDVSDPTQPTERGSGFNVGRTVTDIEVRDQNIDGVPHRFVFLVAKAGLKELAVLDVTGDIVREISSVDLPGNADARSIAILGNRLYLGRDAVSSGPELYVFDITDPTADLSQHLIATAEVGANVTDIHASGKYLFFTTDKSGKEIQVWSITSSTPILVTTLSWQHPAERSSDFDDGMLYMINQNSPASLQTIYAP